MDLWDIKINPNLTTYRHKKTTTRLIDKWSFMQFIPTQFIEIIV